MPYTRRVLLCTFDVIQYSIFHLCPTADADSQIMAMGFFPSSNDRVKVAFQLRVLKLADTLQAQGSMSIDQFSKCLKQWKYYVNLGKAIDVPLVTLKKLIQNAIHSKYLHNSPC